MIKKLCKRSKVITFVLILQIFSIRCAQERANDNTPPEVIDSSPQLSTTTNIVKDTIQKISPHNIANTIDTVKSDVLNRKNNTQKHAKMSFENSIYNFGNIKEGEKIEHRFMFKNVGNATLEIKDAKGSCGCTMPTYPFVPIAPGEINYISVLYDSKNKAGNQKPMITVTSNAGIYKLYLEGFVEQIPTGEN